MRRFGAPGRSKGSRAAGILLAVGLAVTATATVLSSREVADDRSVELKRRADVATLTIERSVDAYTELVFGLRALFESERGVTRKAFRQHARSLLLQARFPGLQAIAFADAVEDFERARYEAAVRRDARRSGLPYPRGFRIRAPRGRSHVVASYIEPIAGNERVLGLDFLGDPSRRTAVERTRRTGRVTATAPIRLAQEKGREQGVILVAAVRNAAGPLSDPHTGRFKGVVAGRIRMSDFVAYAFRDGRDFELEIYDVTPAAATARGRPTTSGLMYDTDQTRDAIRGIAPGEARLTDVEIAGRRWAIYYRPRGSVVGAAEARTPWLVGGAGVILTLLAAALLYTMSTRREQAEALAEQITADLRQSREELARSNRSLRLAEERAREVVEGAHEAFVSIDAQGVISGWNAEAERIFGWSRSEAIGRRLSETIIPERFREAHAAGLQRFRATGEGKVINRVLELSALHRDGREFPVELTISPQRLDDQWVFNAFIRDVTERVAADAAQRLQAEIITNMGKGVVLVRTSDWEIVYANREFEQLFGYDEGDLIGKPVNMTNAPTERDPIEVAAEIQDALARDGKWAGEVLNVKKNGTPFWCRVVVTNFEHPGYGEVSVAVHSDITEQKRMSEELNRSNEELRQFAYVASHDLNEPLRVIAGFVQLLQRRYQGRLDEQADRFIGATVDGVERMQAMIDALLEYSRVGRADVGQEPVDCERIVRHAGLGLQRLIDERRAELRIGSLPTIKGEPALIGQLFQNLISNAVKYGDAEHPLVEVSAERANWTWRFSVEDNGDGVDPRHAEKVFDMFKRLHDRNGSGAGIGLAICKRIVEMHGGRIWVEPREAGGSAFRFTMPADPQSS